MLVKSGFALVQNCPIGISEEKFVHKGKIVALHKSFTKIGELKTEQLVEIAENALIFRSAKKV
jgi:hypothetical protein